MSEETFKEGRIITQNHVENKQLKKENEKLTIIGCNKFGYKNKIGEFKYIDLSDFVNIIKNNTISEIDAKKSLNTLNKLKNTEIKYKRLIPGQK